MQAQLAKEFLEREARAMHTRLDRLRPFSVSMTLPPAAAVSAAAMSGIENVLRSGRLALRAALDRFLGWLASASGRAASAADAQRRFTILRLRFHLVISQFDIFSDVLVQRSEPQNGVWIAGLDDLAADALRIPGHALAVPPLVCYLDRGVGAAIRRARTRLPGGSASPVAVIRVPRERMIGQGIGASLVHEVGHQAATVLDLLPVLRAALHHQQRAASTTVARAAWTCWEKWCSEVIADLWAAAKLGVSATLGLIGVMSLPRAFIFRVQLDDPHPFPWIRVMASCAIGQALYPHAQWGQVARMWEGMYPLTHVPAETALLIRGLLDSLPAFAALLVELRLPSIRNEALGICLRRLDRSPPYLGAVWDRLQRTPGGWHRLAPTLAFAALSQARCEGRLSPEAESRQIERLLTEWAVESSLVTTHRCGRSWSPRFANAGSELPIVA